jgi:pSer/pThr/pTyr-binding forkhead associated (FHA) protein
MPQLVVVEGVDTGQAFELLDRTTFVGRSPINDFSLTDRTVSNRHIKVYRVGTRCFAEDLKSTNGTLVNEVRLEPGEGHELDEGDMLRLGRTRLIIRDLPQRSAVEQAADPRVRPRREDGLPPEPAAP